MSYYLLLRGPLGVGKSTVASRLASVLGGVCVSVDAILEEERLEVWDNDRVSLQSFLNVNTVVVERARACLATGTPVVVEGNFYWREAIDDLVDRLPAPHWVFTLTAPEAVCLERDRQRPPTPPDRPPRAGESLGAEAVAAVYRLVAAVPYGTPIDATGPVDSVVATIRSSLGAGRLAGPRGPLVPGSASPPTDGTLRRER